MDQKGENRRLRICHWAFASLHGISGTDHDRADKSTHPIVPSNDVPLFEEEEPQATIPHVNRMYMLYLE